MPPSDPNHLEQSESESVRWVAAYARHVNRRFNSRAVVSLRRDGEAVRLRQVYALEGGGLVLVEEGEHETPHEHEHAHAHAHEGEGHAPRGGYECPRESWVASPEQVVLEACHAAEGEWCTGFGYLGGSRTPHVLVPRGTEPPPRRGHDH